MSMKPAADLLVIDAEHATRTILFRLMVCLKAAILRRV